MVDFKLMKQPSLVLDAGGAGRTGQYVTEISGAASRVLLVCDKAMNEFGHAGRVADAISEGGHQVVQFDDLTSDPKESAVNAATALGADEQINCVVGLGGGSALDTAKLVAALVQTGAACEPYRLSATDFLYRQTAMIAMPTTAGTGAETTPTCIISQPDGVKNWFWSPALIADMALMDPELTVGLPAFWTFFTGMDALVHSIESRTNRFGYAQSHVLAETGIRHAIAHLADAVADGSNISARAGMMQAAAYGGLAIANTGCAVAHNIGHALGSIAGVPHGRAVSVALMATLDWAMEGNPRAFDRVGELLGGKSGQDIRPILTDLAAQCGYDFALTDDEKQAIGVERLASDMVADANIAMLESTARDASESDPKYLAELTLAA